MTVRTALVAVAFAVVASTAHAQTTSFEPLTPALDPAQFAALDIMALPGSVYTAGWDDVQSLALGNGAVARFFYRSVDGLLVGVLEDHFGNVYGQTKAWKMGAGFTKFNVTKFVIPSAVRPVATLTVFFYNRTTGAVARSWVAWLDAAAN
jgi:hypothetical protein